MAKRIRSWVCIVLLLVVSISPVLAAIPPVSIQIRTASETVQAIRYQTGRFPENPWKNVPRFGYPLVLEGFDSDTEYLFVQQSESNDAWGILRAYQYDRKENVWSLTSFPTKTFLKFRIKASNDIEQMFRYQFGAEPNKPWQTIEEYGSLLAIEEFDSTKEFLFVQQYYAPGTWSETYAYQYDREKNIWNLASSPPKGYIWFGTKPTSDLVEMFNHQYGSEPNSPLETVDISGSPLVVVQFDSANEILFIQQTDGGREWNQPYAYQYDHLIESWTLLPQEQENNPKKPLLESFDLKAYGLFPTATCSNTYSYLIGGGVQANLSLGKFLGYTGLTFSKGPPRNDRVKSLQALSLAIGAGYPIPLSDKMTLIPEVGYGVLFHLLEADFDSDGIFTLDSFIDQQVRLSLYFTYELNKEHTFYVAPLGVIFFEREQYGIMYGCQVGLRVSLGG